MTPATFLMVFVSGCGQSSDIGIAPRGIPDLDPRDEKPCYDPGVEGSYPEALAENRLALADCRMKHANVVKAYLQVMERIPAEE